MTRRRLLMSRFLVISAAAFLAGCSFDQHTDKTIPPKPAPTPKTTPAKKWVIVRHGTHPGIWQQR